MRMVLRLAVAAALLAGGSAVSAHEDFRVIGTVTRFQDAKLDVKSRNGKTTSIRLDRQTAITRDKKKVPPAELKAGLSVVVDAYGDTEDDLLALEIRIVPPIAPR